MAKPRGKAWAKGESGNPSGPKSGYLNGVRITPGELKDVFSKFLRLTYDEFKKAQENKGGYTMLELWACSIIAQGIQTGNMMILESVLMRLLGRPPVLPEEQQSDLQNEMFKGADRVQRLQLMKSKVEALIESENH